MRPKQKGFTLIETVIGIVVLSIAFSILSNFLYPLATQSGDQLHQIRAAELGQSMLNEILAKAFDEHSDKAGGRNRCGEDWDRSLTVEINEQCTHDTNFNVNEENWGADEASRDLFDDVDDYNDLEQSGPNIEDALGNPLGALYQGYELVVTVCNDGDYDGICFEDDGDGDIQTAKLITITVTTPLEVNIAFSTYRANF